MKNYTMKDLNRFERIKEGEITAIICAADKNGFFDGPIAPGEVFTINGSFKAESVCHWFLRPSNNGKNCWFLSEDNNKTNVVDPIYEPLGIYLNDNPDEIDIDTETRKSRNRFFKLIDGLSENCRSNGVYVVTIEAYEKD